MDDDSKVLDAALNALIDHLQRLRSDGAAEKAAGSLVDSLVDAYASMMLHACDGSTARAGDLLGLDRRTLQRRLRTGRPRLNVDGTAALRLHNEERKTWSEIGEELRCHASTARRAARLVDRDAGKESPDIPIPREIKVALSQILNALGWSPGLSKDEIVAATGLQDSVVEEALLRLRADHSVRTENRSGLVTYFRK